MQTTTVEELESKGFSEDPQGRKRFERPLLLPAVLGLGVYAVSFALMVFKKIPELTGIILVCGSLCILGIMALCQYWSRPKSRHTGRRLVKYKNASPGPDVILEVIYVCPESKTFWRRVYALRGHSACAVGAP